LTILFELFKQKLPLMKKIFAFVALSFLINVSFATVSITPPRLKASEIFLPVGISGQKISLLDLSTMKIKELEQIRGDKMSFKDRVGFKIAQKKLRDNIAPDGSFDTRKIEKAFKKQQRGGETGFHLGGFALGLLLNLVGVLIAYLIKDDYKSNRVKWAWIGFGVHVVLIVISIASGA
jgi:hypothetical protein